MTSPTEPVAEFGPRSVHETFMGVDRMRTWTARHRWAWIMNRRSRCADGGRQGRSRPPSRAAWPASAALLTSLSFLAACGSSSSSSSQSPSASSTPNAVEQAIIAAYRAESAAYIAAVQIPDPAYPALAATAVNPLLTQVRQSLVYDKEKGIVGRGDVTLEHPHVVSQSGDMAIVNDCAYSTLILVYAATGQPVPGQPGGTNPEYDGVRSTLTLTSGGTWKVSNQVITAGSCPAGY